MNSLDKPHIELLSDEKGLYGFRVVIDSDTKLAPFKYRPDVMSLDGTPIMLHGLPGKKGTVPAYTQEYMQFLSLRTALRKTKPGPKVTEFREFSEAFRDEKFRQHFFGMQALARKKLNWAISKCIDECADKDAIKIARRYNVNLRSNIYAACCKSVRAKQICETFPVLAAEIYKTEAREAEFRELVQNGVPLKNVAKRINLAMALRRIKPQSAHLLPTSIVAQEILKENSDYIFAYAPTKAMENYRWFFIVTYVLERCRLADQTHGLDIFAPLQTAQEILGRAQLSAFVRWLMKNVPTNKKLSILRNEAVDLLDWYRSNLARFNQNISYKSAQGLSLDWHTERQLVREREYRERLEVERQLQQERDAARRLELEEQLKNREVLWAKKFPEPWLPAGEYNGYSFVPLTCRNELNDEGLVMSHCAADYAHLIDQEICQVYSVRKGDKRLATLEIRQQNINEGSGPAMIFLSKKRFAIAQIRGPHNSAVDAKVQNVVNSWLMNCQKLKDKESDVTT